MRLTDLHSHDRAPVRSVVEQHLCHGCGTCVSACPAKALAMEETPSGFLVPKVGVDCNGCGICGVACPGAQLPGGLFKDQKDPFRGPVLRAYLARANDRALFGNGQSGGALSAIIEHLLRTGQCDGALVTGPVDAGARPTPFVASTLEEIRAAQGSKYCPVALNASLCSESYRALDRPVVVGLPCHVQGIRCLQQLSRSPIAHRPLILGLICSGVYSFLKIEHLRRAAGLAESDRGFLGLRYKDKDSYGWPGDVSVHSEASGRIRVPERVRHLAKGAFRPPRCYLCFDQMNVLSDITFGDPWGIRWDPDGWTVVLTRTEAGQAAMDDAVAENALTVECIDPETVFAGQTIDSRHRPEWMAATAAWREMGFAAPDFGLPTSCNERVNSRRRRASRRVLSYSVAFVASANRPAAIRTSRARLRRIALRHALGLPLKAVRAAARRLRRRLLPPNRRIS